MFLKIQKNHPVACLEKNKHAYEMAPYYGGLGLGGPIGLSAFDQTLEHLLALGEEGLVARVHGRLGVHHPDARGRVDLGRGLAGEQVREGGGRVGRVGLRFAQLRDFDDVWPVLEALGEEGIGHADDQSRPKK